MGEQPVASVNAGATGKGTSLADMRVKLAEHILAQYDFYGDNDIRDILNETKTGAWKKPTVQKYLARVFTGV